MTSFHKDARSEDIPKPNGRGEKFLLPFEPEHIDNFSNPVDTRGRSFMCNMHEGKGGKSVTYVQGSLMCSCYKHTYESIGVYVCASSFYTGSNGVVAPIV